jgi:rare lipoprotein A (peptidoglycan hydrolase)
MLYRIIKLYDALSKHEQSRLTPDSRSLSWRFMVVRSGGMSIPKWLSVVSRAALIGALAISGCSSERSGGQDKLTQQEKGSAANKSTHKEVGEASWYGPGFQGKETANGETFDQKEMTAAHPSLPMGTKAKVTNLENGKKVEVRINDRGPYADDRVIDLSGAAAKKLDMKGDGTTQVKIETKSTKKK